MIFIKHLLWWLNAEHKVAHFVIKLQNFFLLAGLKNYVTHYSKSDLNHTVRFMIHYIPINWSTEDSIISD